MSREEICLGLRWLKELSAQRPDVVNVVEVREKVVDGEKEDVAKQHKRHSWKACDNHQISQTSCTVTVATVLLSLPVIMMATQPRRLRCPPQYRLIIMAMCASHCLPAVSSC